MICVIEIKFVEYTVKSAKYVPVVIIWILIGYRLINSQKYLPIVGTWYFCMRILRKTAKNNKWNEGGLIKE